MDNGAMTETTKQRGWGLRIGKWTLIGMVGLAYAGLFGEVFLRVMDPQVMMPRYITGTDYGIRGNIPYAVYRQVTPEADVEMRINGQGMRSDRDFTQDKPPGTCRIAMLGDSYFMGYEVHYEDTVGALLETRFADLGYRVEVLNFAVSGFSTEEMLHEFENRVVLYEPDIVISQFNGGDFNDNMRPGLYKLDENGVPQPTGGSYLPGVAIRDFLMQFSVYRVLINHSHFYSAIREWAGQTVKKILTWLGGTRADIKEQAAEAKPVAAAKQPPVAKKSVFPEHQTRYTSALLMLSRQRAEAFGMDWFMLEIPDPIYKDYRSNIGELTLDAETMDRVITPVAQFDAYPRSEPWLYREKGHAHLSPPGHQLTTDALMESLMRKSAASFETCRT